MALVWESTILITITKGDQQPAQQTSQKSAQPSTSVPSENYGMTQLDRLPIVGVPLESEQDESQQSLSQQTATSDATTQNDRQEARATTKTDSTQTTSNMDVDDTSKSSSSERRSKSKSKRLFLEQSKLIKPLLVSTSRLGKGLAELFALLVKLCVGSPVRHRRNNPSMPMAPTIPSASAQNISAVFAKLISDGLSWDVPSTLPKHR